jgi:hypothetical protein
MKRGRSVLAATAVLFGCTATAAAAGPTLEISGSKTAIPVGTEFGAYMPGLNVTTNLGEVRCNGESAGGVHGFLRSNLGHSDSMEVTTAYGYPDGEDGCESTVPFGPTAYFAFETEGRHIGTISVGTNSKLVLAPEPGVHIGLYFPSANVECFYTFKTLKGKTNTPWAEKPNYLYFEFYKDKLKFDKTTSTKGCPSKATFTFALTPFDSTANGYWEGALIG